MAGEHEVGRYRLTERLGTGAFATVWLGFDDELDAPVAIKVLADNWAQDADVRARFVAEARLLRRVRDQRVVRVHDIGTLPDGRPYFVMDYADGGTVAELINEGPPLTTELALRLGAEIARAVQVLHDHGVAHRDIKPGNLLLTSVVGSVITDPTAPEPIPQGVVIADLGMAKTLSEASGYTVTAGTPAYMAPEQALGMGFDQRADVYSVAAVTYTLLAGRPPFAGAGIIEIAERSRSSNPDPLHLDGTGAIDRELAAALSFDPDQRPGSAGELAQRLDRLTGPGPDPADAPTEVHPVFRSTGGSAGSAGSSVSARSAGSASPGLTRTPTVVEPAPPIWAAAPADLIPVAAPPATSGTARAAVPRRTSPTPVLVGAIFLAAGVAAVTWLLLTLFA